MTVIVSPTPLGPPAPPSGWNVVFADGFDQASGLWTGPSGGWGPSRNNNAGNGIYQAPFNTNEVEAWTQDSVTVGPGGLILTATYIGSTTATIDGSSRTFRYKSGCVTTQPLLP